MSLNVTDALSAEIINDTPRPYYPQTMWTEKWWDERRPPQAASTASINNSSSASTNTVALTNGSSATQTLGGRLKMKMSNGVGSNSSITFDHHEALSNGHGEDWGRILTSLETSQDRGPILSNSSSPPRDRNSQDCTNQSSSITLKPAAKLAKQARSSLSNGKSLTGRRLVTSKSSPDMDITRGQSLVNFSQRLPAINGDASDDASYTTSGHETAADQDMEIGEGKEQPNGLDRLTVATGGWDKGHTRHSSINSDDWHLANQNSWVSNGGPGHLSTRTNEKLTTSRPNGALSDESSYVSLESPSSKFTGSSLDNGLTPNLSPSPARVFPDLSLDLRSTQRATSGSISERSSWSESSDAASWDSSLKTPPLYDVCDIASSLSSERQTHRLLSMQSHVSTASATSSSSPDKHTRQSTPSIENNNSSNSGNKFDESHSSSWSEQPAILELDTDTSCFQTPTTGGTVAPQGHKKTSRQQPDTGAAPRTFSGKGPVPLTNGHSGGQRAYSLMSDEGVESRPVVLYEYERPKKSLEGKSGMTVSIPS